MSVPYVVCPHCHAGNPSTASVCWMCRSALTPADATQPMTAADAPSAALAATRGAQAAPRNEPVPLAWSVTLALSVVLSLAIAAELARLAPGLLVLFLFVDVPVVGALLLTVMNMSAGRVKSDGDAAKVLASRAVRGVAISLGSLFTFLGVLFLFALALIIIGFVICLAVFAAASHS